MGRDDIGRLVTRTLVMRKGREKKEGENKNNGKGGKILLMEGIVMGKKMREDTNKYGKGRIATMEKKKV